MPPPESARVHAEERRTRLTPNEYVASTEQPYNARTASDSWTRRWEQVPLLFSPGLSLPVRFASVATDDQGSWHVLVLDDLGNLCYTIRSLDGSWPIPHGSMQSSILNVEIDQWKRHHSNLKHTPVVSGSAHGILRILALDVEHTLWCVTRYPSGDWSPWANVQDAIAGNGSARIGPISFVSCSVDGADYTHVLALDASNTLWYTLEDHNGGWPNPWSRVQDLMGGVTIGPINMVSSTVDPNGFLHVFALDDSNVLWYTIRRPDWSWQDSWVNVQEEMERRSLPAIGPTPWVCSAADPGRSGYVHVLAVSDGFGLWHTTRDAVTGAWSTAWENVSTLVEPAIGPVCMASASVSGDGSLEIAAVRADGQLWHTTRVPDRR
jgi:hypothetical protein